MTVISSPPFLIKALRHDIRAAAGNIATNINTGVLRNNIEDIVYDPYEPIVYERQGYDGGFAGSWIVTDISGRNSESSADFLIHSEPGKMVYRGDDYIHGNDEVDRRNIMARIIAEGTDFDWDFGIMKWKEANHYNEDLDEWWQRPRDYMTPTIEELDATFDIYVIDEFSKLGINISN